MRKFILLTVISLLFSTVLFAQKIPSPREESLLNNLKVLIWSTRGTGKVAVKIRIHRGAAFDGQGKAGSMATLADLLFSDPVLTDFFTNDLNGELEVKTNHDYVQVSASGDADQFVTMLESLATPLISPEIDKDTTSAAKAKHLKILEAKMADRNFVVEEIAAERLFGDYPYGRSAYGNVDSINAIDFADLVFLKQRFIAADNATIAIEGDVNSSFAFRAVRRILGGWTKRTEKIPASFRLPKPPDTTPLEIPLKNNDEKPEVIFTGIAANRDDADYFPTEILMEILRSRAAVGTKLYDITYQPNLLRGEVIIRSTDVSNTTPPLNLLLAEPITSTEFERAKTRVLNKFVTTDAADLYLDVDTYSLDSVSNQLKKLESTTYNNVNDVAKALKNEEFAIIVFKPATSEPEAPQNTDPKDPA
ncbi:MAG: M16 family metallopeptidase [Pyrinomonadaceae bacterium]